MNKKEYREYEETVKSFFKTENLNNLTSINDDNNEPFFSWQPCDCCGTRLGGDRVNANGYNPETNEVQEYTICIDCEYYIEYGQLDDMTMVNVMQS